MSSTLTLSGTALGHFYIAYLLGLELLQIWYNNYTSLSPAGESPTYMVPIINPPFADTAGAQVCPKISKTIEIHRNPEGLEKGRFTGENPYFLRVRFFRCRLHTVEVTGSNPVSPILLLSTTSARARLPGTTGVLKSVPILSDSDGTKNKGRQSVVSCL